MLDQLSLEGKSIIVTGGGTGLGRAMVLALARAGADVALAARRAEPLEKTAEEVRKLGRRVLALPTDVTKSSQIAKMVQQTLDEFGKIDVLINNAGLSGTHGPKPIWEISDEEWQAGVELNLSSAFYCSRAVAKHMVERGQGKIINIGSGYGMRGGRDNYIYTSAKGGMVQLTRTLAISLGRYGITCNCMLPGFIPTEGSSAIPRETQPSAKFIPVGFLGRVEDVAPVAVFMASSASDYMNGEFFAVDGGGLFSGVAPTGFAPEIRLKA